MKASELRSKSSTELDKKIVKLREKLAGLRKDNATKEMKNNREIREVRKDLARALTVVKELKKQRTDEARVSAEEEK